MRVLKFLCGQLKVGHRKNDMVKGHADEASCPSLRRGAHDLG